MAEVIAFSLASSRSPGDDGPRCGPKPAWAANAGVPVMSRDVSNLIASILQVGAVLGVLMRNELAFYAGIAGFVIAGLLWNYAAHLPPGPPRTD